MNISVVIPLYNKEQYISRAIKSILAQSVPADEIVVVDDGSTDHSADEVSRIDDCRVRLIRQKNSGEGAARNRGVSEARNQLVAFLDADDEWKSDFLLHIQRLRNNFPDCGAYATAYEMLDPGGKISYPVLIELPPAPWIGIIPNLFRVMQYDTPFCSSSVAIPKHVFYDLKGFPEGVTQGADRMLWIRIGVEYPIAYSPSFQSVYHREALNRVCYTLESSPAAANLVDKLLSNDEIPTRLKEEMENYSARLKIQKARLLLKEGHTGLAKELLQAVRGNRKYRSALLWWTFWSIMPYSVLKLAQSVRE